MTPKTENDLSTASYFVQIRTVERRLLRLALENADGDLETSASLLGLERDFFLRRARILGGVLKGSVVNEPPRLDLDDHVEVTNPVPAVQVAHPVPVEETASVPVEEVASVPTDEVNPIPPDIAQSIEAISVDAMKERIRKSLYGERKEPDLPEIAEDEDPESGLKEEPRQSSEADGAAHLAGKEPKRRPGRPIAVSPYSDYMTSREAEQVLGVSAAGLGYMKNRGEITAIYDENTKIWLYQREQIEAIAAERSRNRRNGS